MIISHEEFQKARRISRAIQEYLEQTGSHGVRSTDVYPLLARKGLIQKDRHNGVHFRNYLKRLHKSGMLNLIPQCKANKNKSKSYEWRFYSVPDSKIISNVESVNVDNPIVPDITEAEIDDLILKTKSHIDKLPKIDTSILPPQILELRKNYPRAYEKWTEREYDIMNRAFVKFKNIYKVAELLRRQPSVVRKKLK
ncbi:hypothetical protein [Maribacter spongiicola]|uniref:hypothetical protein n=1 Tax=Maribacter spongiicola TaxID=1206753 RepID=UPI00105F9EE6|nr:hypothetical protein [Maribacter spongiicola]